MNTITPAIANKVEVTIFPKIIKSIIAAINNRVPDTLPFLFSPSKMVPPRPIALTIPVNAPSVEENPTMITA